MSREKRVYCYNCKYYVPMQMEWGGDYCNKPIGEHSEAYSIVIDRILDYREYNVKNDCKYHEPNLIERIVRFLRRKQRE